MWGQQFLQLSTITFVLSTCTWMKMTPEYLFLWTIMPASYANNNIIFSMYWYPHNHSAVNFLSSSQYLCKQFTCDTQSIFYQFPHLWNGRLKQTFHDSGKDPRPVSCDVVALNLETGKSFCFKILCGCSMYWFNHCSLIDLIIAA